MALTYEMEAVQLAGSIIMENGGETYRAEDTATRMGLALGCAEASVFAVPSGLFITLAMPDGEQQTSVLRIHKTGIDLQKVNEANQVSRLVAQKRLDAKQAAQKLKEIQHSRTGSVYLDVFGVAISSGGFAFMFGGGWIDFLVAFVTGAFVQSMSYVLAKLSMRQFMYTLLGSMISTFVPLLFVHLTGYGMAEAAIAGGLMPYLPGLAMTNAVQDTMRGDMLSGVAHAMQAILTACMIAGGALAAHWLFALL